MNTQRPIPPLGTKCIDTWTNEESEITEYTNEPNYYLFKNANRSTYSFLGFRYKLIEATGVEPKH